MYIWRGSNQIPAEPIQAGGETCSDIHELITSVWKKEELPEQWKESVIVPMYKKGGRTEVIIEAYHCYQLHTKFYRMSSEG
jgi:hypothetical protein